MGCYSPPGSAHCQPTGGCDAAVADYCGIAAFTMRHIYLDYNTTTPLAPEVQEAMVPFLA